MKRADKLYKMIRHYVKDEDIILDWKCGMSPLAKYFHNTNKFIGFDIDKNIIDKLKYKYPKCGWINDSYENITFENIDILLVLGIVHDTKTANYILECIKIHRPKIVMLDTSTNYRVEGEEIIERKVGGITEEFLNLFLLIKNQNYSLIEKEVYENRFYCVLKGE